MNIIIGEIFPR